MNGESKMASPHFPFRKSHSPILIAGPTAVGKSEIALQLAKRLAGEIISVDSMQVYRGLDIGTAKPSAADRARVPHHLIDICDLTESFDAAHFARLAHRAATEIQTRGRVAMLCGGTGLYFQAFLEGLCEAPPADAALRAELEITPQKELLDVLRRNDPVTYRKIDKKNPRRVIRAIEVIRLTGKPFSEVQAPKSEVQSPKPSFFCLTRAPEDLRRRIDVRVDEMFSRGLVDETRGLLKRGLEQNKTAMQAIGYRQVVEFLHGERSLTQTIELVKVRTRQFAKRQLTWFRGRKNLEWIELKLDEKIEEIAEGVARRLNKTDAPASA
jgi:tRNA dimethylallyltransferase